MAQFDMSALLNKVKDFKDKGQGGDRSYPKASFIPEGTHKGRFIIDPNGELFTDYYSYGYFGKGIRDPRSLKPSDLPEGFKDQLSATVEKLAEYHWKYKAKKVFLVWFWLEETNAMEKDRWEPKNLYCLIGNGKFESSFLDFIQSVGESAPEELQKSLDPNQAGVMVQMMVTSGQQGQTQLSIAFPAKNLPPIDMAGHVYTSLEDAYIRPGFNQEKYDALLKSFEEELNTYVSTGAKTMAEKQAEKEQGANPEIPAQAQSTPAVQAQQPQPAEQPPVAESQPVEQTAVDANQAPWMKFKR